MNRRELLLLGLGASACAGRGQVVSTREKIEGICFDLFTLFDPRSVVRVATELLGERAIALCEAWRSRQFEYAWLRLGARQYRDFHSVTHDALVWAARASGVELTAPQRNRMVDAYSQLEPWPDTVEYLSRWKAHGLKLATLANYSPRMLTALVEHAGLSRSFDALLSTDAVQSYKPAPEAYALGPARLGLPAAALCFSAFGGWDAAGARWFGFRTFWVNRLGVAAEALEPGPHAWGPSFAELDRFVTGSGI